MAKSRFTIKQHQERMRDILVQPSPLQRPNTIDAFLERARSKPRIPRLPLRRTR